METTTDNYYTPNYYDLLPDMDVEIQDDDGSWHLIQGPFRMNDDEVLRKLCADGRISVKRLDHEDIVELGWEEIKDDAIYYHKSPTPWSRTYIIGIMKLRVWFNKSHQYLEIYNDLGYMVFAGRIRNYSELARVMEMCGVRKGEVK